MFCIKCGKELPPDGAFCPECGTPVGNSTSQRASAPSDSFYRHSAEAVIGANTAYYLTEFQRMQSGQKPRFNWAAFLLGPAMCFYRKCENLFQKYFLIPIVLGLVGSLCAGIGTGIFHPTLMLAGNVLSIVFGVWTLIAYIRFGLKFNSEYYAICEKKKDILVDEKLLGVTLKSPILFVVALIAATAVCMAITSAVVRDYWNVSMSAALPDSPSQSTNQGVVYNIGMEANSPVNLGQTSLYDTETDPTYGRIPVFRGWKYLCQRKSIQSI